MDTQPVEWRAVADAADIPESQPLEVAIGNSVAFLVRAEGEIRAFQGLCPHAAARLGKGRIEDGWLQCPHHMARFRMTDGVCGKGWGLPALKQYEFKLDDGVVYLSEPPRVITPSD